MATYYTIPTQLGQAAIAHALANGAMVDLAHVAVGDSNGTFYEPLDTQTALVHEVYRGTVSSITVDAENPNRITCEMTIPASQGGWNIRETGIIDGNGNLFAVGKVPLTYKPLPSEGSSSELTVSIVVDISDATVISLEINPNIVLASRTYVDSKVYRHRHDGGTMGILDEAVAGGTANALTITLDDALIARVARMPVYIQATANNTGACTINDGIGTVNLKKFGDTDLVAGDIVSGQILIVAWDGTRYQLIGALPKLHGNTLTLSQNGLKVTDNIFAALAGSISQIFNVADGASGKNAVNYAQVISWLATKAALAGSTSQTFQAADGSSGKQVVNISQFVVSLGDSGYIKIPFTDGTNKLDWIYQWGQASSSSSITTITLPITFPHENFGAGATDRGSGRIVCGCGTLSTSQIRVWNGSSGVGIQYWAVGY